MWWISIVFLVFAGIWNSIMDILKTRYHKSVFIKCPNQKWIDPDISWVNKWKGGDPKKGERFIGSSTVFVWITDFWHFAKFLMLLSISFSIVFYSVILVWWVDWFILYCSFTIPFEIFYSKIFIKK